VGLQTWARLFMLYNVTCKEMPFRNSGNLVQIGYGMGNPNYSNKIRISDRVIRVRVIQIQVRVVRIWIMGNRFFFCLDLFVSVVFSFWLPEATADYQTPSFSGPFYKNHFSQNHLKST
jgi:hypothetical protein